MNIKRFRTVSKIGSILLKVAIVLLLALFAYISYQVFSGTMWFSYSPPSLPLFNSISGGLETLDTDLRTAATFITPIAVLIHIFILWKGSQLFKRLADGEVPFTEKFAQSIKRLSIVLMVTDLVLPLLYSLAVTMTMEDGHYIIIGVGASFLIGLILYVVARIFYYGIELQTLSDETV